MKERLLSWWIWLGTKITGWKLVDVYSPDDNVEAVTLSSSEEYIEKVGKIELIIKKE